MWNLNSDSPQTQFNYCVFQQLLILCCKCYYLSPFMSAWARSFRSLMHSPSSPQSFVKGTWWNTEHNKMTSCMVRKLEDLYIFQWHLETVIELYCTETTFQHLQSLILHIIQSISLAPHPSFNVIASTNVVLCLHQQNAQQLFAQTTPKSTTSTTKRTRASGIRKYHHLLVIHYLDL